MDREEILRRVIDVVGDVLGISASEIKEESEFVKDLGAESIQSLELVAAFEEEFGIEMAEEAALQVQSVGQTVDFIGGYVEDL